MKKFGEQVTIKPDTEDYDHRLILTVTVETEFWTTVDGGQTVPQSSAGLLVTG